MEGNSGSTRPAASHNTPPQGTGSEKTTSAGENESGSNSGVQPNAKPKMTGLQPNQTAKKSLRSRMTAAKKDAKPTDGMGKKNTPEVLQRQKQQVLSAVNQLSIKHGKLKILGQALDAVKKPNEPPKGIVIKVLVGDKMVPIIPPDKEALKGQDMGQLLKDVEEAINGSYQECIKSVGAKPLPEQLDGLQKEFMAVCTKLGKKESKMEVMQTEWNAAFKAIPKAMKVDYSGGSVLIERVVVPKPKPQPPEGTPQPPPSQPSPQPQG